MQGCDDGIGFQSTAIGRTRNWICRHGRPRAWKLKQRLRYARGPNFQGVCECEFVDPC